MSEQTQNGGLRDRVRGQREKTEQQAGNSGTVEKRSAPPQTIAQFIEAMKGEMARALPKHMSPDRLARIALTEVRRTPRLAQCTQPSFGGALMTCAQLGLEPGVTGEAYLIPRKNGRLSRDAGRDVYEVQLTIGYQGMAKLFWQSPLAKSLDAQAVYENDEFEYAYGLEPRLAHKPTLGDRGNAIAYYSVATLTNGGFAFVVLSRSDVEKIRIRSNAGTGDKDSPWKTDYDEMAKKGLALDTPIPTATGWTTMGQVERGDVLFDRYGNPAQVIAKSVVKHLPCYRITFANGRSIVCDHEHLWVATIGQQNEKVHPIGDLFAAKESGQQVVIPVAQPLALPAQLLPLDPWVLGFWLGDGTSRDPVVTCHEKDLPEIRAAITSAGYLLGAVRRDPRGSGQCYSVRIRGIGKVLADLGVLGHKHVPSQYLRGSVEQRRALLAGLMDSDGCADKRNRAIFSSNDKALADAVAELARSLGETVTVRTAEARGFGKVVITYRVEWTPTATPFTLRRKADRIRPRAFASYRGVKSIERVDSVPTQCIAVDSPTRTFLAGEDMVPTHNTCLRRMFKLLPKSPELARALSQDEGVRTDWAEDAIDIQPEYPDAVPGEVEREDGPQGESAGAGGFPNDPGDWANASGGSGD